MRIGSCCSGYGGLDLGLMAVVGGSVAWHVEYDKHPAAVLAERFPGVPNLGDLTGADFTAVEPVDWLTAGYPCQPFSHAGKRRGKDDERHLWPDVARAIGVLRPRNVLLENVRGHISLGLADVLADLSGLGYDARWGVVRAADAGAPHGRARIFIVAADAGSQRQQRWPSGVREGWDSAERRETSGDARDGSRPAAPPADSCGERHGREQDPGSLGRVDREDAGAARQRERARAESGGRGAAAPADAEGVRRGTRPGPGADAAGHLEPGTVDGAGVPADADRGRREVGVQLDRDEACDPADRDSRRGHADRRSGPVAWGAYGPAVRRWERVTGRPAPRPTEPGRTGERLSPRFVEWLMGLPAGWVTDIDIPRNAQLMALGNGVVPQQAALALRLLGVTAESAAA